MFSVEQLVANCTFDRLVCMDRDIHREFDTRYPYVQAVVSNNDFTTAFGLQSGDYLPTRLVTATQPLVDKPWPSSMLIAFETLYALAMEAVARRLWGLVNDPLPMPDLVSDYFMPKGLTGAEVHYTLSLPMLHGNEAGYAKYSWEGHALLVMWLSGEVQSSQRVCPRAFNKARRAIEALHSVWELGEAQRAAMVHDQLEAG